MIINLDVTVRNKDDYRDAIEVHYEGKYMKFVRERTGTMPRDEYGYWVCSECGEDLPAWVDKYPARYCPYCGMKVVSNA